MYKRSAHANLIVHIHYGPDIGNATTRTNPDQMKDTDKDESMEWIKLQDAKIGNRKRMTYNKKECLEASV